MTARWLRSGIALMATVLLSLKSGLPFGKSLARAKLVAAARMRRMVFFMVWLLLHQFRNKKPERQVKS